MSYSNIKVIISLSILVGILFTNCTNKTEPDRIEVGQFLMEIPSKYVSINIDSVPSELGGLNDWHTSISESYTYGNNYIFVHHISDSCGAEPVDLINKANQFDSLFYQIYPVGEWEVDSIIEKDFGHVLVGQGILEWTFGDYHLRYLLLSLEGRSFYVQVVGINSSSQEIEDDINSVIQLMKIEKE